MSKFLVFFFVAVFVIQSGAQIIQWRGPNRDGKFDEKSLMKSWPENGPELILEVEKIGKGYSSPIWANGTIYVTGMIDTLDNLTAIDMQGKIKWQIAYGRSWNKSFPDTRSTPVLDDNRIYVQSGTGRLNCVDVSSGNIIWARDVDKEFETEYHNWGNSETPLVAENLVICTPGGKKAGVVAFDKITGKEIWKSEVIGGQRSYVSPAIFEFNGAKQILAATSANLAALDLKDGKTVWTYQYAKSKQLKEGLIWANTPVFKGDQIFLSIGYNNRAVMLKVDKSGSTVSEAFTDTTLDNHHHGIILHDGYLYGSNWQDNRRGKWVCMDWNTGQIKYEAEWDTKGAIVMADEMLYCYNEKGNVGLVKPSPEKFDVVSQFKVTKGGGPHWAHPFIADGKLFLRHGEVLMVYDIKAKK